MQFQNINLVKDITLPHGLSICFDIGKTLIGVLETIDMALQVKIEISQLTRIDINLALPGKLYGVFVACNPLIMGIL